MGIATQVNEAMQGLLTDYVADTSARLCDALQPVAVAGVTIYLFFQGWSIIRGHSGDTLPTLVVRAFRIAFIVTLALVAGHFQTYVVNTVDGVGDVLVDAIAGAQNMPGFLDAVYKPYVDLARFLFSRASTGILPDWAMACAGVLVMVAGIATMVLGLGYYVLAKVGFALICAVGPAFILCAMIPPTQRFTELWLGQALHYTLLYVLVAASVSMVAGFGASYAARIYAQPDLVNILSSTLALDMAVGGLLVVLLNLNSIASALTGGIGLSGVGREVAAMAMRFPGLRGSVRAGGSVGGLPLPNPTRLGADGGASEVGARVPAFQRAVHFAARRSE